MGGTRDQLVGFDSLCPWFCWNFYNTILSEIASWLYFQFLSIFCTVLGKILASFRPRLHLIYLSASIDILFVCPSLLFLVTPDLLFIFFFFFFKFFLLNHTSDSLHLFSFRDFSICYLKCLLIANISYITLQVS